MGADQEFDVNGTGGLFINSSFRRPTWIERECTYTDLSFHSIRISRGF